MAKKYNGKKTDTKNKKSILLNVNRSPHFHPALYDVGPWCIQHMAEPVVCLREKHSLIDAGRVLKKDKLHLLALSGMNGLSGNLPSDGGNVPA